MSNYKNLLISEPPLQVLPTLAKSIGLNEAIVLQQLHYWIENPKADGFMDADGVKWIFNSYEQWKENFPFWSERTIQRIFIDLEKTGIIVSDQFDKGKYDRRKFYRIDYDKLAQLNETTCHLRDTQIGTIEDDKLAPSLNESETTTETISENTIEKSISSKPEKRKIVLPAGSDMAWGMLGGETSKEMAAANERIQAAKEVNDAFERTLNFNPLPWGTKPQWERLQRFLSEKHAEDPGAFARYKSWRDGEGKYEAMQNKQIYDNPDKFIACWPWKAVPEAEQRKPGVGFYG